ncbi:hypothetical protein ET495_03430 [Xylanimonas allomyrinae]|uniref:D-alanyl-D-alanine carboxypeptidase-like core domain-containing protein n=1 Tax=Xylanimonas allomyrinae TaxID=2509459 RepID=A0A4P6EWS9_9MICO|nr:M15 family metallopeptidase [Xylanimonas allomyrinae]QAY62458.1 hypothetical protein ET495_03430 [Xylanimonas allomyrinae]
MAGATVAAGARATRTKSGRRVVVALALALLAVVVAPIAAVVGVVAVVVNSFVATETDRMQTDGTVAYNVEDSTFVDVDPNANGWGGFTNGNVAPEDLCTLPTAPTMRARCDAAEAFGALTAAFRAEFGHDIAVTDAYRSYSEQVAVKASKGFLAAAPGFSNHGWGLALDLGSGINSYDTAPYAWMKAHGWRFGFFHPTWAEPASPDFTKSEPWHWQYLPAAVVAQADPGSRTSDGTPDSNRALGKAMAAERGWTGAEWTCLEELWTAESGWNHRADNPTSSAYGIPQALPGSKMASVGLDWASNPATQIAWGLGYIAERYDTPCSAWGFWNGNSPHWY